MGKTMPPIDDAYRKAELIELHDRGVMIHPFDYSDALAGWSQYAENSNRFVIDGAGLAELAGFFGLATKEKIITDQSGNKKFTQNLKDTEIPVLRKPADKIGAGYTSEPHESSHKIKDLWAKIIQPQLISIRFVTVINEDSAEKEEIVQEVTYSGSFSIWWSTPSR
jgi:hypothetical protein